MKKYTILLVMFLALQNVTAQTEIEKIREVLQHYIEGTANGEPDRVRKAFDDNLNLYHVKKDTLVTWKGKNYIGNIKKGKKSNRIGRIVSIDYENDAAVAKVEILMPKWKRIYTDYMMLLKVKGSWKIIHKSFTFRPYPQ